MRILLLLVSWNVTNQCNLRCAHCYRDATCALPGELTTDQGYRLLDQVKKAGASIIVFSGGEPFMRKDIYELTMHAKSIGLRPVYGTNGTFLSLPTVEKIKHAGGECVAISLHMVEREKMDAFCGVHGVFDAAIKAMENCARVQLPFQINTTVLDRNISDIPRICELAKELGAISHHVLFMVPIGRATNISQEMLKVKDYESLIKKILIIRKNLDFDVKPTCAPQFVRIANQNNIDINRYTKGCLAGISYCSITPTGDVWPCPFLPVCVGNVRNTPFSKIWEQNPIFDRLRTMNYTGACSKCEFRTTCGGCRAHAYFYYNDYMAQDPWCSYRGGLGTSG